MALVISLGNHAIHAEPITGELAIEPEKPFPEIEAAEAQFRAGEMDKALQSLETAVVKHAELPPARLLFARLLMRANQLPQARAQLEKVAQDHPDDPEAYAVLGDLAFGERRIVEAGMLFDKVAQLAEKMDEKSVRKKGMLIRGQAGQGAVAEFRGQWVLARDHLEAWKKLDDKNAVLHRRLAMVLFNLQKPKEAYAEFKLAAKLSAQMPAAEIAMGRLYHLAGNDEKNRSMAADWMKLAVSEAPQDPRAHVGVAEWYLETGNLDEAKKQADEALQIAPDSVEAKLVLGLVARMKKDYATAETLFSQAYLAAPDSFTARNQLALVLAEQEDQAKQRRGLALAEDNAQRFQQVTEAAATLGWLYVKAGQLDRAERALNLAASTGSITPDTAYYLARLLSEQKKKVDARHWCEQALKAQVPFFYRDAAEQLLAELRKQL
ncbi:MAG: tetratricopeptide repeat protein [Pirellulales bacterium]|nr:tetratricopeptide repeat protein [Pirellulales bacterium]